MRTRRFLKWLSLTLVVLAAAVVILVMTADWNWLRVPFEQRVSAQTGRDLTINGNLKLSPGWPLLHLQANDVTFANPSWAKEKHMISADAVEFFIGLPQLFKKRIFLSEVRLVRPVVYLQISSDGRKNWLLDKEQKDENARVQIGRLILDHGRLSFDDPRRQTSLRLEVSTQNANTDQAGVVFDAQGRYHGKSLRAQGTGGSILALNDDTSPYPLRVVTTIGHTTARANGTIMGLSALTMVDMQLALRGDSLAELYNVLGIAFPETHAYNLNGHLTHRADTWRYEKLAGRIGNSDFAGTLQVDLKAKRPYFHGELVSQLLDIADLGPLIGAQQTLPAAAGADTGESAAVASRATPPATRRVLPDIPFRTERWDSVDADVQVRAKTIRRAKALPIENLVTHLKMQDSLLTLDPLDFGVADGTLATTVSLDGRKDPIQASAKVKVRKIRLKELFPTVDLSKTSIGEVNGEVDLQGNGNSVGRMLGTADGKFALVVAGGEISKLMMEMAGLHLWDIFKLKVTGDQIIPIRCGVADFAVKNGVMWTDVFILDTAVTNIGVNGNVNLRDERLDLTLTSKTKQTKVLALRGPIYIHGTFAEPQVEIDKGRVTARSLGAVALGAVNPLLALVPLIERGPGMDSDCGRLIERALQPAALPESPNAATGTAMPPAMPKRASGTDIPQDAAPRVGAD